MPTITDSRLGAGTLKFGTLSAELQVASATLKPKVEESTGTATLGNPDPAPEMAVTWSLSFTMVSDWEKADGVVAFCTDSAGSEVTFEFVPNVLGNAKWSGTVQVRPVEIGGKVNEQNVVDAEFPVVGQPLRGTFTAPTGSTK